MLGQRAIVGAAVWDVADFGQTSPKAFGKHEGAAANEGGSG